MQTQEIIDKYNTYREGSLENRRFKHSDIIPLINSLREDKSFTINTEGTSIAGRDIFSVKWGSGDIDILMWSQMHGDESTATMALFDIFNFLKSSHFTEWKKSLAEKVTLHFVPMLNPDGAEYFQRRNALGVDINRDALRLQSPESKILKGIRDRTNAEFGFNLHDQGRVYAAGNADFPATLSFLAPAYNYEKDVNEVRGNAMKLIAYLNNELQNYIPNGIAKYNDDFEPRAFGDNIQLWGTSTILIESGGYRGDREKQVIRKMNFIALIESFMAIADGLYSIEKIENYEKIPFNERLFFDLLIKNATVEIGKEKFLIDLGINFDEVDFSDHRQYLLRGMIEDVGDLSIYKGYKTFDVQGLTLKQGKVYDPEEDIQNINTNELLEKGYLYIKTNEKIPEKTYAMNILSGQASDNVNFKIGDRANFVISNGNDVSHIVLNGFIVEKEEVGSSEFYGLVIGD